MTSRILVAVSSPWASEKLARPIADLARRLRSEVLVAHVATVREEDEHESDAARRGEQALHLLSQTLQDAGVSADGVMLFADDTAKALMQTARDRGCTLIVLGLTGRGVLKRLIAGDVPANIIRQSELPVLLCPANWSGQI